MSKPVELFIDGACSGNPGEAAIGVVIRQGRKTLKTVSQGIGEATNNIAEYTALIYGLQEALMLRIDSLDIKTDSELLCYQLQGRYKIKDRNLKFLNFLIRHLLTGFKDVKIRHIPREKNHEADKLASQAIKKAQAKMVAPLFDSREESPSSEG